MSLGPCADLELASGTSPHHRPDGDALTYAVSWARVSEKRPPRPVIAVATRGRGPRQPARPAAAAITPTLWDAACLAVHGRHFRSLGRQRRTLRPAAV